MTGYNKSQNDLYKEFFQAMIPAVLGAAGMSLYFLIDSLFVGICLGDEGFAAQAIGWSLITLVTAVSTGIGMGGSIRYSLAIGRNDQKQAKKYYLTTLWLLFVVAVIMTIMFLVFCDDILHILKATEEVFKIARDYLIILSWGLIFQVGAYALPQLVRNKGAHKTASVATSLGFLCNIVFDYILMFVFNLGVFGCGLAYIMGQMIIFFICLFYLIKNHNELLEDWKTFIQRSGQTMIDILKSGISPSGVFFSSYFVSTFTNMAFLTYGDSVELAAFMVVMSLLSCTSIANRGFLDGAQPLISRYYGEGEIQKTKKLIKWLYLSSLCFVLTTTVIYGSFRGSWGSLFGVTSSAGVIINNNMWYCISGYIFVCFARITMSYLYATNKSISAAVLTYGEGLATVILIFTLPCFFGVNGVWAATIIGFTIIGTIAVFIRLVDLRKK